MIIVSCAIIEDRDGNVLATQRSPTMSLPLKWEFPGGKVEPNETPEQAIMREIMEELNIEIEIKSRLEEVIHEYPTFNITLIPFICNYIAGELKLYEHNQFLWLSPDTLLDLDWAAADVPIVKHYLKLS